MRSVFACSTALRPLRFADWTAMPDWNAIGVATSRITTSTSETSISGVMLGSVMPSVSWRRLTDGSSRDAADRVDGLVRGGEPEPARLVLGLGEHHGHSADDVVVEQH